MAEVAQGTELQYGDGGAPPEFTSIGEIVSITGPSMSAEAIDLTDLDDAAMVFASDGTEDSGEISLEINFDEDDATHTVMVALARSGAVTEFELAWPAFTALQGGGFAFVAGDVTVAADTIDEAGHTLLTGQPVRFSTGGTLPTATPPIVVGRTYYVIRDGANTIQLAASNSDALGGTQIDLTVAGAGGSDVLGPTRYAFDAIVTGATPGGSTADKLTGTLTLKLTKDITIT